APLPLLLVDNPYLAFQRVVMVFRPETHRPPPGVHATAIVARGVTLGEGSAVGPYCVLESGVRVGDRTVLMAGGYLGDDVVVGGHCIIVAQVGISGSTRLEDYVTIGGQAGLVGHITIGRRATIGAKSGVSKSVAEEGIVTGYPAMPHSLFKRVMAFVQ